jgi:membrane protein
MSDVTAPGVNDLPPAQRSQRPSGFDMRSWRRVLSRLADVMARENFTLIAAGCAFYALLALAPSLAALAALYGFIADPADIRSHLDMLRDLAPPAAFEIIEGQVSAIENAGRTTLGWVSIGAALFAVYSARAGVRALMAGVSVAYRQKEQRSLLMNLVATYLLTLTLIVLAVATLALLVLIPVLTAYLPVADLAQLAANALRWPVAMTMVLIGLGLLYRYAPRRRAAQVRWLTPGAIAALALWVIGSAAFSLYLSRFGAYNETYGALGAVAALLMWFWLSALATLIGAVLNAELEHETAADTTVGEGRPMGERGAYVADHVARG